MDNPRHPHNPEPKPGFKPNDSVVATGKAVEFQIEQNADARKIDHVWITLHAGGFGRLRIAVNTYSLKHASDGFDPRMRVGFIEETWRQIPRPGVLQTAGLDYADLERVSPVIYRETERVALEKFLQARTARAIFIEAWGAFYRREEFGIHQVHSRRASCSMPMDLVGRDGALRFYFSQNAGEMILFKYCGQV
ncbi:MAG: hypothetical protein ACR2G0_00320 [Chthoniobacterales bacterium]